MGRVSAMARLTRSESQSRNRDAVMTAARRLFLAYGYNATSLAAIADEAGFSTGVVYSNFAGKPELALLVLRELQVEHLGKLRALVTSQNRMDAVITSLQSWGHEALESGWPRLELEFALEARHDSSLVQAEASRAADASEASAALIGGLIPTSLQSMIAPEAVAEAFLNVAIGIAVRHLIDPDVNHDRLVEAVRRGIAGFAGTTQ